MDPVIKDLIQVVTWLIATIGVVIAAFKTVSELRRSNDERADAIRERQVQFRWRQAEMARTILDQTWNNSFSRSALKMLDWSGLKYERAGAATEPISHENIYHALRTTNTHFNDDEQYVRDCFDQLFDDFERMEHYLNIGLVNWEDIQGRLDYHVNLLARKRDIYEQFLKVYQFKLALLFLRRFPQWSAVKQPEL